MVDMTILTGEKTLKDVNSDTKEKENIAGIPDKLSGIVLLPGPAQQALSPMHLQDYKRHRYRMLKWLLDQGKNPEKEDGLAVSTVRPRAYRIDQFYRWVWEYEDRYTKEVTSDHADKYVRKLARGDTGESHQSNAQKALISLFNWRAVVLGEDKWTPEDDWRVHSGGNSDAKDQPDFTKSERLQLREAVLDFKTVPHYNTLDPGERTEMKTYLAQRLEKPKGDISPSDFDRTPTRKFTSLVHLTLDAGLRPCEIEAFQVNWFDRGNTRIVIPEQHSRKNRDRWECAIRDDTALYVREWLEERKSLEKYDDSDRMWLTKYGNSYGSQSLNRMLEDLCKHAGVAKRDRTWYSIRRSTASAVGTNASPEHARQQLRHKQTSTTMRYIQPDDDEVRDALNRGG